MWHWGDVGRINGKSRPTGGKEGEAISPGREEMGSHKFLEEGEWGRGKKGERKVWKSAEQGTAPKAFCYTGLEEMPA